MWPLSVLKMPLDPFEWLGSVSLMQKHKNKRRSYQLSLERSSNLNSGKSRGEGKACQKIKKR